ncbi:MAG: hypothetical protein ACK52V_04670 [Betaproteobacteria bacterium]
MATNASQRRAFGEGIDKGAVDLASVRLTPATPKGPVIGAIESGIPVPPKPGRSASELYEAVAELKAGQSRLFEHVEPKKLYGHAKRAKENGLGSEYAVRATDNGCRVWRIS